MRPAARSIMFLGVLWAAVTASSASNLVVKYRSASAVYVDAGKAQGLAVGDRLTVVEKGAVVGELEITYLADQSASCRIVSEKRPVRAGDVVIPPVKPPAAAPAVPAEAGEPSPVGAPPGAAVMATPPLPRPWARLRGGISLGYSRLWDDTPSQLNFEQKTARVDLSFWDIGGQPLSFQLRFRSRQDERSRSLSSLQPTSERRDRLYEASFRYQPSSDRYSLEAGRIASSSFVGLGYLDGALARMRVVSALQVGVFLGRRAEIDSLGLQGAGQKYGVFVALTPSGRYAVGAGEAVVGLVRETDAGAVSREYVSLETRLVRNGLSLFERAELDWNRGWRRDLASSSVQVSNLTVSLAYRMNLSAQAVVSYDRHQNYRTSLNRTVPQAFFDDLMHQGLRGNLSLGGSSLLVTAGGGVRFKDRTSAVNAYSANLGFHHGGSTGLRAGLDGIGFTNGYTKGAYGTAGLGHRFGAHLDTDLIYGISLYTVKSTAEDRVSQWLRLLARGDLGRGVFLSSDLEYARGDDMRGPRLFIELGWRF